MKIALFHAVPPSGALRAVRELAIRLAKDHALTVLTIDLGAADRYANDGRGTAALDVGSPIWERRLSDGWARLARWPEPVASVATIEGVRAAEIAVASDITSGDFDVALVFPCVYTQSPPLLERLEIPSLYYVLETRRRWYEGPSEPQWRGKRPRGVNRFSRTRYFYDWLNARRDRRAVHSATALVCDSYYTAEAVERAYGLSASVSYLGVDTSVFTHRSEIPPEGDEFVPAHSVVSVGAVEATKGQHLIVEALSLLPPPIRPVLDVVFERVHPPYLDYIMGQAAERGVDLRMHREVSDTELARLYSRAAATVCASRLEPFGLTPLESMACGTPVVAVAQGGFRETVLDGENGYLVDRDPISISRGIERVLAGELATSALDLRTRVVERWEWDGAAARVEQRLTALLGGSGS